MNEVVQKSKPKKKVNRIKEINQRIIALRDELKNLKAEKETLKAGGTDASES